MATEPKILNQAAIDAAKAKQQAAQQKVAAAQAALKTATAEAPTKAGAAILGQGGDLSSARYTAQAAAIPGALGPTSQLSVEAQTKPYQQALTEAQNVLGGVNVPAAQYASATDVSAYDQLEQMLTQYGLTSLVGPLKSLFESGITNGPRLTLALQETPEYKTRFSANATRIKAGLAPLSVADYVGMEDAYQNIMRQYGLPASYYTPDSTGKQAGFEQLLANDVSATELTDRIASAQNRVLNAPPQVQEALRQFYPGITNGDILAYTLDPTNAIADIKRKIAAAEIGGAALGQGMGTSEARAKELANYGITAAQAQQGYSDIAQIAPRGSQLAAFYGQSPYDQTTAEQEIFNLAGSAEAAQKRKKLSQLEQAAFSGKSGTASNALSRDRAVSPYMLGQPGAGAY